MYFGSDSSVDGKLFKLLSERSQNMDMTALDPEIEPLVYCLNRIPFLTTVWSCSGHDTDPWGYLTWVGDESWANKVDHFLKHLLNEHHMEICISNLCHPPVNGYNETDWYSSFAIRWYAPSERIRNDTIYELSNVVCQYYRSYVEPYLDLQEK